MTQFPQMPILYVPPPEPAYIPSNGEILYALLYRAPGAGRHPTLICCHGSPGSPIDGMPLGYALRAFGWNVLTFHYRGMWLSSGEPSPADAPADLRAVVDFARADPGVDPERIAIRGYSFGAWATTHYVPTDQRIRTVLLVSPYVWPFTLTPEMKEMLRRNLETRATPRANATLHGYKSLEAASRAFDSFPAIPSALDVAPQLADRRVLLVTGDNEDVVPPEQAPALARAIGTGEWKRHPDAAHAWIGSHQEWLTTTIVEWLTA